MRNNTKTAFTVLGLATALLAGGASAASLAGSQVSFSFNEAQLGLFGTASVVGDSLHFAPVNFKATGTIPAVQTINITVTANSGYLLSAFNLAENGAYKLPGLGDQVFLQGTLTALDIEGDTGKSVASNILAQAPFSGTAGNWSAGAAINLPVSGWGGNDALVTSVSLTLSNQLFAMGGGEIWKNAIRIDAIATPVPEAETYAMMLAGLGLVGLMVRRRARQPA